MKFWAQVGAYCLRSGKNACGLCLDILINGQFITTLTLPGHRGTQSRYRSRRRPGNAGPPGSRPGCTGRDPTEGSSTASTPGAGSGCWSAWRSTRSHPPHMWPCWSCPGSRWHSQQTRHSRSETRPSYVFQVYSPKTFANSYVTLVSKRKVTKKESVLSLSRIVRVT